MGSSVTLICTASVRRTTPYRLLHQRTHGTARHGAVPHYKSQRSCKLTQTNVLAKTRKKSARLIGSAPASPLRNMPHDASCGTTQHIAVRHHRAWRYRKRTGISVICKDTKSFGLVHWECAHSTASRYAAWHVVWHDAAHRSTVPQDAARVHTVADPCFSKNTKWFDVTHWWCAHGAALLRIARHNAVRCCTVRHHDERCLDPIVRRKYFRV